MNEHSAKFERVRGYYDSKLWTESMVRNAVGKWITEEEADEIIYGPIVDETTDE